MVKVPSFGQLSAAYAGAQGIYSGAQGLYNAYRDYSGQPPAYSKSDSFYNGNDAPRQPYVRSGGRMVRSRPRTVARRSSVRRTRLRRTRPKRRRTYGRRRVGRSRKSSGRSRRRRVSGRLSRAAILRALITPTTTRDTYSTRVVTGVVQDAETSVAVGTPMTNMFGFACTPYGLRMHLFQTLEHMRLNNNISPFMPQFNSTVAYANDGFRMATSVHSYITNTSGTSIMLDWWLVGVRRMANVLYPSYTVSPPVTGLMVGTPLAFAQIAYQQTAQYTWNSDPDNLDRPIRITDIGATPFGGPLWKRVYKVKRHRSFRLEHGQSTEMRYRLPTLNVSANDLAFLADSDPADAEPYTNPDFSQFGLPGKTHFIIWRIRGAAGAAHFTGDNTCLSSLAIASADIVQSRRITLRYKPRSMPLTDAVNVTVLNPQPTQVYTANQYGAGETVQPDFIPSTGFVPT